MPNQTDQSTLNMSKIGPAIASVLILLIVIGYSIKTIKIKFDILKAYTQTNGTYLKGI